MSIHSFSIRKPDAYFVATFLLMSLLYLANIGGWVMHDDEGTDFYEVWRFQLGEEPGEDFIAAQQPLFLYAGAAVVALFGREATPLRLLSAVQVLAGALLFSLVVSRIWGWRIGQLTMLLTLSSGQVYEMARLFRPDPLMFAWELAGLGMVLLAVHRQKRPFWAIAGLCYGVAFLWKPFGALPVGGLVFFFLVRFWRERQAWRTVFFDGVAFAAGFLLIGFGGAALMYANTGFYYREPFEQHLALGQDNPVWYPVTQVLLAYLILLVTNPFWLLIWPLMWLHKSRGWFQSPIMQVLLWQLVSPLIFFAMTRPMFARYLIYLTPVFALLLVLQLDMALKRLNQERPSFAIFSPLVGLGLLLLIWFISQPNIPILLLRQESGTDALAALIAERTAPDDVVLADYATLNFVANRPSIYEASIIAGGKIRGGIITGELLIERIEREDVQMVLIHTEGGDPPAHQLSELQDYDAFVAYLSTHFTYSETFDRAGQLIDVYER